MQHLLRYCFLFSLLFVAGKASSQTEQWDSYLATVDGKPASILVDMALFATAPDKRYPFLVITGPQSQTSNSKGLLNKQEIIDLEQILDVTTNFITGVTAKVLTGTFTYKNQRLNYYYVKDTSGVRNAIQRVYNRNFKDYKYVVNIKHDPNWLNYINFLYPSEESQNWMENNKVITTLLNNGDSLNKKRNINFAACFGSDTERHAFTDYIRDQGYSIQKTPNIKNATLPFCEVFSRFDAVNQDSITVMTRLIKKAVKKYNGIYNGWDATLR